MRKGNRIHLWAVLMNECFSRFVRRDITAATADVPPDYVDGKDNSPPVMCINRDDQ